MEYKIIGGDGVEYGPVSLDEIKAWIRDGRVGRQTLVSRTDTKSWSPASSYAEFQADLAHLYGTGADLGEQSAEPVGFWPRLGAYIVDRIVLWLIFYAVWEVVRAVSNVTEVKPPTNFADTQAMMKFFMEEYLPFAAKQMALYLPIHILYEVILNGRFGATVGKMIIGARIVRLDGSRIGYGTAFLRWLCARLSDLICYIGYLFIGFRQDKRAMHDLLVGTKVIYRR